MDKYMKRLIQVKRKGSVLLQTLVICVVLAYIAVTLVQWILARYASAGKVVYDTMDHTKIYSVVSKFYPQYMASAMVSDDAGSYFKSCNGSTTLYNFYSEWCSGVKTVTKDYNGNSIVTQYAAVRVYSANEAGIGYYYSADYPGNFNYY